MRNKLFLFELMFGIMNHFANSNQFVTFSTKILVSDYMINSLMWSFEQAHRNSNKHVQFITLLFLSLFYLFILTRFLAPLLLLELLSYWHALNGTQFGTDLRQCSCFRNFFLFSLSFSITLFIQCILPLTWMGRCWLAKTNHMTT